MFYHLKVENGGGKRFGKKVVKHWALKSLETPLNKEENDKDTNSF